MKYSSSRRKKRACFLLVLATFVSNGLAQESAASKGKLKVEGTHIARLTLRRDDGHIEEWSNLSGTIAIPVGSYEVEQLTLSDNYSCSCQSKSLSELGPIEISEAEPAVLKAGGPLRQSIDVERRGSMLVLTYHLRGIGNEEYEPVSAGQAKFAIYRGDTAVHTDSFTYT